jgi:hypothetical protein
MGAATNPFPDDADRAAIWTMLVERDITAFLSCDWQMVADDFVASEFQGLHAHASPTPDNWTLDFPTLADYREEWLRQAAETAATSFAEPLSEAIFRLTNLQTIEIKGERALARKKFDGVIKRSDGSIERLDWQTLYFCAWREGRWKISGFVGYLPRVVT